MLELALVAVLAFCAGAVGMWFWYPYNLARHPEKIASLQARAEKLVSNAQELFDRTLESIRDAQK